MSVVCLLLAWWLGGACCLLWLNVISKNFRNIGWVGTFISCALWPVTPVAAVCGKKWGLWP